jgi:threonine dehydratase
VQAEGASPMVQSIKEGEKRVVASPKTLAEGIRVGRVGDHTFEVVRRFVDRTLTVTEDEIAATVVELMERNKVVAEAAAVTPVAAILSHRLRLTGSVCAVISGGNIDLTLLERLIESGLARQGRLGLLRLRMEDRPGQLQVVLDVIARVGANVKDVRHDRAGWKVPVGAVEVEVLVELRNIHDLESLYTELTARGFERA